MQSIVCLFRNPASAGLLLKLSKHNVYPLQSKGAVMCILMDSFCCVRCGICGPNFCVLVHVKKRITGTEI